MGGGTEGEMMIDHVIGIVFGFGIFILLVLAWAIAIALIIVPIVAFSMGVEWTIKHIRGSRICQSQ